MKRILHSIALIALAVCCVSPCNAQVEMLDVREGTGIPQQVRTIYEKGADYLAATQLENGTWDKTGGARTNSLTVNCGLCTMAFLSTGEDPNFGKYAKNIRKALRHIIREQNPKTGYIPDNMYVHGFCMLALSEAYGAVDDEMLWAGVEKKEQVRTIGEALELAVRLTVSSQKQNPLNGWQYSPDGKTADTSAVGTVLMGLLAARNAGIEVPDDSIDKALAFMKARTSDSSGRVGYTRLDDAAFSAARSAIACLVYRIGKRTDWQEFKATKDYIGKNFTSQDRWSHYTSYYQAQSLFQADYPNWQKWNRNMIRKLGDLQSKDGKIGTSQYGPAYSTSMSLLALALNYRFLPIYER